jgi:hypothetical protein
MSTPRKAYDRRIGRVSAANPEADSVEIAIGIGIGIGTTVGHGTLNVYRLTINDVTMVSGRNAEPFGLKGYQGSSGSNRHCRGTARFRSRFR